MKILAIVPLKFDGTSYYRAYGVFPHLKKLFTDEGKNFEVNAYFDGGMGYSWADLLPYDILFLQRPSLDAAKRVKLIEFCKKMKKKIWIDFDDNLFRVPMENRVYDDMTKEVIESMYLVLSMADLITVSTPALKAFYEKIGLKNRIEVIPNAWNFELFPFATSYNEFKQPPPPQKAQTKFLWRGSDTHSGDLFSAGEAIFAAANHHGENVNWHWMAYNPVMLTEGMPREIWTYHKGEDIINYFYLLKQIAPQVMFFPLRDNEFNHCKSNIAWMEATYAGAVCIAPDWPEWQKPGVINYRDYEHLAALLETETIPAFQDSLWKQSRNYIYENLSLDVVNVQRKQILESI